MKKRRGVGRGEEEEVEDVEEEEKEEEEGEVGRCESGGSSD